MRTVAEVPGLLGLRAKAKARQGVQSQYQCQVAGKPPERLETEVPGQVPGHLGLRANIVKAGQGIQDMD